MAVADNDDGNRDPVSCKGRLDRWWARNGRWVCARTVARICPRICPGRGPPGAVEARIVPQVCEPLAERSFLSRCSIRKFDRWTWRLPTCRKTRSALCDQCIDPWAWAGTDTCQRRAQASIYQWQNENDQECRTKV